MGDTVSNEEIQRAMDRSRERALDAGVHVPDGAEGSVVLTMLSFTETLIQTSRQVQRLTWYIAINTGIIAVLAALIALLLWET